ncbi:DUF1211 domain-containing protein [Lacticaseibacillus paracasei]|nr:DUF1211 domain-containing protein [Lacticaseibacillus paracasei]
MNKGRVEAFTDAVVAIILTLWCLSLKPRKPQNGRVLSINYLIFLLILSAFFLSGWLGTTITTCLP